MRVYNATLIVSMRSTLFHIQMLHKTQQGLNRSQVVRLLHQGLDIKAVLARPIFPMAADATR